MEPLADVAEWQGGWWNSATRVPSPNFDARPAGVEIDLLVMHYISLPPGYFRGNAIQQLFCNTLDCSAHPYYRQLDGVRVSSHFLIRRHGAVTQFVDVFARAWHAGRSSFLSRDACNDFSVGIEMEGDADRAFTASQYRTLARTVLALRRRLPLRFVTGHSDIAPGRKQDPGPRFDWSVMMAARACRGLERPLR